MYILKTEIKNSFNIVISTQYFVEMMSGVMTHISQTKSEAKAFNTKAEAQNVIENNKIHLKDFIIEEIDTRSKEDKIKEFEDKKETRIERYKALAEKNADISVRSSEAASRISSFIPMGQPILVGHHSEKRHRRDIKRIDSNMQKCIEASKKSDYYEQKANTLESEHQIKSNDPEATDKLELKIKELEKERETYKEFNKNWKKLGLDEALKIADEFNSNIKSTLRFSLPSDLSRKKLPTYLLSNLGQNIKRYKDRLEKIKGLQTMEEQSPDLFKSDFVEVKIEDQRINLYFSKIPDEELRSTLKRSPYVFKWSSYAKCWTRKLTESTHTHFIDQVKELLTKESIKEIGQ